MRKFIILWVLMVLCGIGFGVEINSLASLKTQWAAGGTHTIVANTDGGSGGVYTLDADITCDGAALTLVPTASVVVDGAGSYETLIKNTAVTLGDPTGTFTFTFEDGQVNGIQVEAATADTAIILHYVYLNDNANGNGLECRDGAGYTLEVNAYNCQFNNNDNDGASLSSSTALGTTAGKSYLDLCDCVANDNGSDGNTHNGLTAHKSWQVIRAFGCTFNDNYGPALAPTGMAQCVATKCSVTSSLGSGGTFEGTAVLDDCTFMIGGSREGLILGGATQTIEPDDLGYDDLNEIVIKNCRIINTNGTSNLKAGISGPAFRGSLVMLNTVVAEWVGASQYSVQIGNVDTDSIAKSITMQNCTIANGNRVATMQAFYLKLNYNIFSGMAGNVGIRGADKTFVSRSFDVTGNYDYSGSGYNVFWDFASSQYFYPNNTNSPRLTDKEIDPQLDSDYIAQNPEAKMHQDSEGNWVSAGYLGSVPESTTTEISIMGPTVINVLGPN